MWSGVLGEIGGVFTVYLGAIQSNSRGRGALSCFVQSKGEQAMAIHSGNLLSPAKGRVWRGVRQ